MIHKEFFKNIKIFVDNERMEQYSVVMEFVDDELTERRYNMLSVKQLRIGANLTLEDASALCNCSVPTFQKWEKDPGVMELRAFHTLIKFYNEKNPTRPVYYDDVEF